MLRVENLGYRHLRAEVPALGGLDFQLNSGQVLVVCGHSGSGKSTLLSILSGLIPHYFKGELSGRVTLDGDEPRQSSLRQWGRRTGLMMQNPETQFLAGTVAEEIALTLRCRQIQAAEAAELTERQIARFRLEEIRGRSVFQLSEGQKQKVVLAALTALKPKLLLLDEPSANLDPFSTAELAETLAALKDEGLSMVIADHRLNWLDGLADQALVLQQGRTAAQGGWDILGDESLREQLNLRTIKAPAAISAAVPPKEPKEPKGAVVVEGLRFAYPGGPEIIDGLDAVLPYGRVTVLTGPSGRGKTTLARLLCGLEKPGGGRISFGVREGGQVVLQNADHQLYMATAKAEVELSLKVHGVGGGADEILASFGLGELAGRHPQSLSGGEKQRLVVAAGQAVPAGLLVLDEPTSGLDGFNLRLMAAQIRRIAAEGPAVLVVTHDLELASLCADYHLTLPERSADFDRAGQASPLPRATHPQL
ncbi:ATP-binding cassette domain-containing protein [Deltaproteobacteria bacterium OttesenSCG-928-K17]|nr:ATP-binding cassette domain-containing protein [Deltaproteobacteria bacterium OttesenSCG-928-K17]